MLLLYSIFNKIGALMFSLKHSKEVAVIHVYVLYYFILMDFLIACHYKRYIMSTLFWLLMSS